MQFGYLMNATADSANKSNSGMTGPLNSALSYYNRFNYSLGGGVEVHPYKGVLVGARMNVSLTDLYKIPDVTTATALTTMQTQPSFMPEVNIKSNLFQIYMGWTFGK